MCFCECCCCCWSCYLCSCYVCANRLNIIIWWCHYSYCCGCQQSSCSCCCSVLLWTIILHQKPLEATLEFVWWVGWVCWVWTVIFVSNSTTVDVRVTFWLSRLRLWQWQWIIISYHCHRRVYYPLHPGSTQSCCCVVPQLWVCRIPSCYPGVLLLSRGLLRVTNL